MLKSTRILPGRFIAISNDGPEIRTTDYWTSDLAAIGNSFLSWNAGAARLLLSQRMAADIAGMKAADHVIISRGSLAGFGPDALEVLFDDGSDTPYCVHLARSHYDHLIAQSSSGPTGFTAWTMEGKAFALPAWYRVVRHLPDLSPLKPSEVAQLSASQAR